MVHTRATNPHLVAFDCEVDKTFHHNLRERRQQIVTMATEQTLRELTAANITQHPLAVTIPALGQENHFELKSRLIHQLPKFHGLVGEDPIKHMGKFHNVCMSMKPANITESQIKMRAFAFILLDAADDWYYSLPTGSIDTWDKLHKAFLEKFFPAKKENTLKKAISNIEQEEDETLYDYNGRFKKLYTNCPFHGYDTKDLVLYIYGGLLEADRRMIDAACGGNILNVTPDQAMAKITEMAEGTKKFGRSSRGKGVNYVGSSRSDDIAELKEMITKLTLHGTPQQVKTCGICL